MSSGRYITGLRAVEQLLASESAEVRRLYAEYQTVNPRVEAIIKMARQAGIDFEELVWRILETSCGEIRGGDGRAC